MVMSAGLQAITPIRCMIWTALGLASFLASGSPAHAQVGSGRYSSIVVDAGSGAVLSGVNTDELRHPASLAKMMTAYMLFEALRRPPQLRPARPRVGPRRIAAALQARVAARNRYHG